MISTKRMAKALLQGICITENNFLAFGYNEDKALIEALKDFNLTKKDYREICEIANK